MTAKMLDGAALAARTLRVVAEGVADFAQAAGRRPTLATVLVGDDPASQVYIRMKINRCREAGMISRLVDLPTYTTTKQLVDVLDTLSSDREVDGILLQHPVPPHADERAAFEAISPGKDVDGVTRTSFAQMAFAEPGFTSATPGGIMRLLAAYNVDLAGTRAVIIGRSPILGRPIGMLMLAADATVTFCHSHTTELAEIVRGADVLVAAVGRPEFVRGQWIKPGAVVIDAGYNPGNVGDVDYAAARTRARLITPVPGGVGPMTIATLMEQTLTAARSTLVTAS